MSLAEGGHLTHGTKVNFSGRLYDAAQYGIDPTTALIDYDNVQALAEEHKPKLIIAGFSAYSRVIDWAAVPRDCRQCRCVPAWSTWRTSRGSSRPVTIRTRFPTRTSSRRRRTRRCVVRAAA